MKIHTGIVLLSSTLAGWCFGADDQGKLAASEQAAVVTALNLVKGYGHSNQYVLVKHEGTSEGSHRVSIWVKDAENLTEAQSTSKAPTLLAIVESTRRKGVQIKYQGQPVSRSGNESACRSAVAYRAQQGWLPSGFWMNCRSEGTQQHIHFHTEPNRWPGDHCTLIVSDLGVRFIGGA